MTVFESLKTEYWLRDDSKSLWDTFYLITFKDRLKATNLSLYYSHACTCLSINLIRWIIINAIKFCFDSKIENKKLNEKSREHHNYKPHPTDDTNRRRKKDKKAYKINTQMHEKHLDQLSFLKRGGHNANRTDETRSKTRNCTAKSWEQGAR